MTSAVGRLGRFGLSSYFTLLVLFLYAPLVVLVVFSFNDSYIQALPLSGFTTKWFHAAFANTDLTSALRRSAMIGLLDGLAATALGTMAARGAGTPGACSCGRCGRRCCCCRWWCPTSCSRSAW